MKDALISGVILPFHHQMHPLRQSMIALKGFKRAVDAIYQEVFDKTRCAILPGPCLSLAY